MSKIDDDIALVTNVTPVPYDDHFDVASPTPKNLSEKEIKQLKRQGFTSGLIEALVKNTQVFPLRIWVIDNSGSMNKNDGKRFVETKDKSDVRMVDCTRWKEIQETVSYHICLAGLLESPTMFRLLNNPGAHIGLPMFCVAYEEDQSQFSQSPVDVQSQVATAMQIMSESSPTGATPLTNHVLEISEFIKGNMLSSLEMNGQKVAVILATDGTPSNELGTSSSDETKRFVNALHELGRLPVWIVIRLCTNDDSIVEYYNNLDSKLEFTIEVLDDFMSEAHEVYEHNKWLNYTLPLHRCREVGYHHRLFDLLDERKFTKEELRDFFVLLFGKQKLDGVPDPDADWENFVKSIERIAKSEGTAWNPNKQKMASWINFKALRREYREQSCSIM